MTNTCDIRYDQEPQTTQWVISLCWATQYKTDDTKYDQELHQVNEYLDHAEQAMKTTDDTKNYKLIYE